ncbi:uncharacterized protein LOC114011753 [Falco peregrinus]|uniref:uncharacterized protein LOC114011753 n=2 Tax=Falco TaxID=8952 RepID=UPI00247AC843|nr:uncharacterized protein LOC114011753 [Falco peregrinus]
MRPRRSPPPTAMPPLADPEAPPLPRDRDGDKDRDRDRDRGRRRLLLLLAALEPPPSEPPPSEPPPPPRCWGRCRGGPRRRLPRPPTMLLSAGSLALPSGPSWRYEEGISGVFLSEDVQVTAGKLRVTAGGLYLLYGQFALTCTAPTCPPGTVTLQLWRAGSQRPLLAIPLVLAGGAGSNPERSGLIQAIGQLQPGDVLSLALDKNVAEDTWQLAQDEREGNFVGLLRIAGG